MATAEWVVAVVVSLLAAHLGPTSLSQRPRNVDGVDGWVGGWCGGRSRGLTSFERDLLLSSLRLGLSSGTMRCTRFE